MASQKFLLELSQPMHLSAQQLGDLPDVEKTAMGNKDHMVRNLLKIGMMDLEYTHPDLMKDNPRPWTLLIDGWPVDVRLLPVEFQRQAFDMGPVPCVLAEAATDD